MIRVLHYVGKMDRGGMETLIMNLYRNIDRTKIQFDFAIHGTRNGDFEEEIYDLGGKFYQFPHMRNNPSEYRKKWRKFWEKHCLEYTVFHMHTNSLANIIALEEAYKVKIPVRIIHSHSSFADKGKLQFLNNFLHKLHRSKIIFLATDLIACSDKAATWMFGGMQLGQKQVVLMNNGIDIEKFAYSEKNRKRIRDELGIAEDTKLIGQVGAFLSVKNHKFSVAFMNKMLENNADIKLLFVGDGPLRDEIKKIVMENGMSKSVLMIGKRADVECILSALDLYIMPSLYEGLPVSLVEAQVNGVPSIVSDSITKEVAFNDNLQYLSINQGYDKWVENALIQIQKPHCANIGVIKDHGFDIRDTADMYRKLIQIGDING